MKGCRRIVLAHHLKPKPDVTSTNSLFRSLGRNKAGVAISALFLAVAAFTLYRVLHGIDLAKVVTALDAQSGRNILDAGAFVVAGYVALIFYDVFALRTIGRRAIPFQVAAVASFTSYTIGHALGAATLTGGAVRLRVYSVWGLGVADIAKIAVLTGMTYWLGTAVMLGGALSYAPEAAAAMDRLPILLNRGIGIAALCGVGIYLVWLVPRRRAIGYSNWRLILPKAPVTLLQICIGAADLSLVTLGIYTLLPPQPAVGFVTVLIIFVSATLIGTVSHVPGNLGIIEAAMLLGLPEFEKEELLASLLTFRVLYFVIPFMFAMLALGLRELGVLARPDPSSQPP